MEQGEVGGVTRRVTCTHGNCCGRHLVGTGWANSCLGYTNVVREHYTYLVGASSYNHNTLTNPENVMESLYMHTSNLQ